MFTVTGMAGSYARMLWKVERFNTLRAEKEQIKRDYSQLEEAAREKDVQVASLGSIAGEVSALYGLKTDSRLLPTNDAGQTRCAARPSPGPPPRACSWLPTAA